MSTLFVDLEARWWVLRRGMRSDGKEERKLTCSACGEPWGQGEGAGSRESVPFSSSERDSDGTSSRPGVE